MAALERTAAAPSVIATNFLTMTSYLAEQGFRLVERTFQPRESFKPMRSIRKRDCASAAMRSLIA
ncbi:hypothetical protein [Erythrobacter sp. JK5]|uniref:hypothetical protein n=1 Tax=Erythrobacter sp. JK5 TaxID=2829500 RepID=UPI001BA54BDF|nr:hypothetical protein [Erythrobacter sp. JK5]QUL37742.1 hypothetical protein KDC96_15615 [Erythrobacter sp. JK5]